MKTYHPIHPIFDENSRILILGSFPSVKSRETAFFYGHPQNRFWRVLATLMNEKVPTDVDEKTQLLLSHHVALWDVVASCEITGSADSSMRDVEVNDLSLILNRAPIRRIFVNGKTAEKYYNRYTLPVTGISAVCLPSTSPANAAWSLEKLISAWHIILEP